MEKDKNRDIEDINNVQDLINKLDNPDILIGILEDYGAFRDDAPIIKDSPQPSYDSGTEHQYSWSKLLVGCLIIVCALMALTALLMIILSIAKEGEEIDEWILVLASSLFNIYLLFSFL